jgi:hypothetical protein
MAGGGRWQGCSGARGKEEGGFYRPGVSQDSFARASWPTRAPTWARGGGDVRRSRRPMRNGSSPAGECAQAACHQPRLPRKRHGL